MVFFKLLALRAVSSCAAAIATLYGLDCVGFIPEDDAVTQFMIGVVVGSAWMGASGIVLTLRR